MHNGNTAIAMLDSAEESSLVLSREGEGKAHVDRRGGIVTARRPPRPTLVLFEASALEKLGAVLTGAERSGNCAG
jgi:hypothetical protein